MRCLLTLLTLLTLFSSSTAKDLETYEINLDLDPSVRYAGLFDLPNTNFNETVWKFYNDYFANDALLTDVLYGIAHKRGFENEEQQAEIQGLSDMSKLPLPFVQGIQMLYELQTIMVPIVNFTKSAEEASKILPEEYKALSRIPWRGPGCTGIIARASDNTVYHARNLDFSPVDIMGNLVYNAVFTKNGEEIFRSQMVAGYTMVITGARFGDDGYAIERNTRYADHKGGEELRGAKRRAGNVTNTVVSCLR
ncbi:hypothetical protein TL16_g01147 [Triparma laevis f. inornata]|uniref:ceramidase n=1 Tax=Triparma laevis f. inornata TaxID=1714386 RepID=A0A9W6ZK87_9STRA|nr:hypothetical protein TL16_g01147 [Triparma laevis f. inornata]